MSFYCSLYREREKTIIYILFYRNFKLKNDIIDSSTDYQLVKKIKTTYNDRDTTQLSITHILIGIKKERVITPSLQNQI